MKPDSPHSERESVASNTLEPLVDEFECSRITARSVPSLRRDRLLGAGIPFIKCGFLVRYDPQDIREYIQRNKHRGRVAEVLAELPILTASKSLGGNSPRKLPGEAK
jgi:hypothetical protein